jgi:hypothetical protein
MPNALTLLQEEVVALIPVQRLALRGYVANTYNPVSEYVVEPPDTLP